MVERRALGVRECLWNGQIVEREQREPIRRAAHDDTAALQNLATRTGLLELQRVCAACGEPNPEAVKCPKCGSYSWEHEPVNDAPNGVRCRDSGMDFVPWPPVHKVSPIEEADEWTDDD